MATQSPSSVVSIVNKILHISISIFFVIQLPELDETKNSHFYFTEVLTPGAFTTFRQRSVCGTLRKNSNKNYRASPVFL